MEPRAHLSSLVLASRCVWVLALAAAFASPLAAQVRDKRKVELPGPSDAPRVVKVVTPSSGAPADYKSEHFLVHSDLVAQEAHALLGRLETMLALVSKYWGRPLAGTIECYVVKDLANWPAGSLDPVGRAKIAQGAGITLVETLNLGDKTLAAKAVVYATADRGTPQHEAVHAYCGQTFGRVGPLWYSEGMAEMGNYWRPNDASVRAPDYVVDYIRRNRPKPLREILGEDIDRPGRPAAATGDSWQNYAWRWALCHMLDNNPNYSSRFRALGLGYLTDQNVSFADAYGPMMRELAFEYRFFVRHLDDGYRVDLCRWDWSRQFQEPGDTAVTSRVAARRGWQPSGLLVSPGRRYEYSAKGAWRLGKDQADLTADGKPGGAGRLEGVVFNDFHLSEQFALGASGTFAPPGDGQLYLRCRDAWNDLADNRGAMSVQIKLAGTGAAGPQSSPATDRPDRASAKSE
jgi:hypothetical protein